MYSSKFLNCIVNQKWKWILICLYMKFKKIFIQVYIILCFSICSSQEITSYGIKYTVTVRLTKDYKHDCDCQSRVISNKMFDFKIIEIDMKDYFLKNINIIIPCPDGYGDHFFKKGNIFKIEFYDNCNDMSIDRGICEFDISKRKRMNRRFWMHSIELVTR